ncbi:peptidoglycan DD-metalloendopeptidase family protein [bacterium]|nr:peptidoglycan DD-metalloendopeptidase family protein [bacterium]
MRGATIKSALAGISFLALAACASQNPAMVEYKGEEFFGKDRMETAYGFANPSEARIAHEPAVKAVPSGSIGVKELEAPARVSSRDLSAPAKPAPIAATEPASLKPLPQFSSASPAPISAPTTPTLTAKPVAQIQTASDQDGTHVVQQGETLYRLSKSYNVPMDALMQENGMRSPSDLKLGMKLRIPGSAPSLPVVSTAAVKEVSAPAVAMAPKPAVLETKDAPASATPLSKSAFVWPVQGKIISHTGSKLYNDGINIAAAEGTPVKAASAGTVVHAGNQLEGYGNLVIIKHDNGWLSAYAHTQNMLVKKGEKVNQGQTIAYVGKTGHVDSPQLHFSLRQGKEVKDPIAVLGKQDDVTVAAN